MAEIGINNICIGRNAGENLTTESYQCCLKCEGVKELQCTMTPNEYKMVKKVIDKMIQNKVLEEENIAIGMDSLHATTTGNDSLPCGETKTKEWSLTGRKNTYWEHNDGSTYTAKNLFETETIETLRQKLLAAIVPYEKIILWNAPKDNPKDLFKNKINKLFGVK